MRDSWGTQTNIFYFVYVVLVVIDLFHASIGLSHLDFSNYNRIYPDIAHFQVILGLFGLLKAHKGHQGTSDQCFSVCL
jgi:hypothetical protein